MITLLTWHEFGGNLNLWKRAYRYHYMCISETTFFERTNRQLTSTVRFVKYHVPVAIYNSYIICYDITKLHLQRTFIRSDGTLRSPNKLCQLLMKRFNTDDFLIFFTHIFDLSFIYLIFMQQCWLLVVLLRVYNFLSCGEVNQRRIHQLWRFPL